MTDNKKKPVLEILGPHYVLEYRGRCPDCVMYGDKTRNRYMFGTLRENVQVDPADIKQFKGPAGKEFKIIQSPKDTEEGTDVPVVADAPMVETPLFKTKVPAKKPVAKRK